MYGIQVDIWFKNGLRATLRNVTEIHYNYRNRSDLSGLMVAFESDIHQTGATYNLEGDGWLVVAEFETRLETAIAPGF